MNCKSPLFKNLALSTLILASSGLNPSLASTVTVNSTGATQAPYSVTVTITPVSIVAPSSCAFGYNYNVTFNYSISFTGTPPASLYTLQPTIICGTDNLSYYGLPLGGSAHSGSATTTTNPYTSATDCATATVITRNCLANLDLTIQGPDIANQTIHASSPLPISLVRFDALPQGDQVLLTWTSANDAGSGNYTLQRSADTRNWVDINSTDTKGSGLNNYQFMDLKPLNGMNYYRLQNKDAAGTISYSTIIGVQSGTSAANVVLYPNPSNTGNFRISGIENRSDWTIRVTNSMNQELLSKALDNNEISLPVSASGLYFVRLTNNLSHETKTLKFLRN